MNLPNSLSVFRLCLVPIFVIVWFSGLPGAGYMAAGIYGLATFTDWLDGYIARKFNLVTNLGRVLDPLGDKFLVFSVLYCLNRSGYIPLVFVLVYMGKEILMGLGGLFIHRRARVEIPSSNLLGKTATVLFFVTCATLMLFPRIPHIAAVVMVSAALGVSIAAFISYALTYYKIMKKGNNAQ